MALPLAIVLILAGTALLAADHIRGENEKSGKHGPNRASRGDRRKQNGGRADHGKGVADARMERSDLGDGDSNQPRDDIRGKQHPAASDGDPSVNVTDTGEGNDAVQPKKRGSSRRRDDDNHVSDKPDGGTKRSRAKRGKGVTRDDSGVADGEKETPNGEATGGKPSKSEKGAGGTAS